MKTFEEFVSEYKEKGYLNMGTTVRRPSKPLNDSQLETAYHQYERKIQKREEKVKVEKELSKDALLSQRIRKRDKNKCRLLSVLAPLEYQIWKEHNGGQKKVDAAHVFGKGSHPWMRYEDDNVVCLNRFSHSMLDTQHSPIDGKLISKEEHESWWIRIVGKETYDKLLKMSEEKRK